MYEDSGLMTTNSTDLICPKSNDACNENQEIPINIDEPLCHQNVEPASVLESSGAVNEKSVIIDEPLSHQNIEFTSVLKPSGAFNENSEQSIKTDEHLSHQNIELTNVQGQYTHASCQNQSFEVEHVDLQTRHAPVQFLFDNLCEIARFSNSSSTNNNYFIGCKWSPDGTCLLSNCADYTLRVIDLPHEFHSVKEWDENNKSVVELKPSLEMTEGGRIYDYAWYPLMSSWNPATCCFISSSNCSPVHLWDAYTGKIRASYRAYDFADELHHALSLAFSVSGEDIFCGFLNFVKIFDISRPGKECVSYNLKEISGQKGIVSCISQNPTMPELFAVGNYRKTIGLYSQSKELVSLLDGQRSGITHLKFSDDGLKLFSGARMDNEILCWDMRNTARIMFSAKRIVMTNQRIYFDLTSDNKYLVSGGTDGQLRIWDTDDGSMSGVTELNHIYSHRIREDCVNGVSLHGVYPIIATSSGQQQYPHVLTEDDDDINQFSKNVMAFENCIQFWWAGKVKSNS